jgi:hypothetical protein
MRPEWMNGAGRAAEDTNKVRGRETDPCCDR